MRIWGKVSKKERDSSLNVNNRIYNQSIRRDASAKINKKYIVYNAKKDRIITLEDIEKAISENRYNKKEMTSNLIISSEDNKDNIKTNRDEHENVILTEVISNITKDNEEIKEENKRDADDDEVDINVVSKPNREIRTYCVVR